MSSLNLEFVRSPEDEFKSKLTPGDWQLDVSSVYDKDSLFSATVWNSHDEDTRVLVAGATVFEVVELSGSGSQVFAVGDATLQRKLQALADFKLFANAKELFNTVLNLKAIIENSDVSTGVCMCGEGMSGHADPFDCGHSAVDSGAYYAVSALKAANKLVSDIIKD